MHIVDFVAIFKETGVELGREERGFETSVPLLFVVQIH